MHNLIDILFGLLLVVSLLRLWFYYILNFKLKSINSIISIKGFLKTNPFNNSNIYLLWFIREKYTNLELEKYRKIYNILSALFILVFISMFMTSFID